MCVPLSALVCVPLSALMCINTYIDYMASLVCNAHSQTHNVYIHTAHPTTVRSEPDMPQEAQQVPAKRSVSTVKLSECHALTQCIHT